jgi:lauroyl/myristoyl acyltransferase
LIAKSGDTKLKKNAFYDDMRKTFRLVYPEKTDAEIDKIIDGSYEKFEDVIQDM